MTSQPVCERAPNGALCHFWRLLNLRQITLQRNARHDRAGVAFVGLRVLALVALVEADDVGHGIGAVVVSRYLRLDSHLLL